MIAGTTSDIVATVFPVLLIVLMGIIGTLQGGRRAAVVSASIILGAFLGYYWGPRWTADTAAIFTGVDAGWQQLILSYAVLILSVLVLGYGLGTYVAAEPITGGGRTWGLVLGIANGAALAGWLLFYVYTALDRSQASSPLYQNSVSAGFMVLALWSPVGLALLGALAALIAPFRRRPVVVTTTTATSAATATPASAVMHMAPLAPPPVMPAYRQGPSQVYGPPANEPYSSHNAPTAVYPYVPPQNPPAAPPAPPPAYNPGGSGANQYGAGAYPLDSARVTPPAESTPYSSAPAYDSTPYSNTTTTTTTSSTGGTGNSGGTSHSAAGYNPPSSSNAGAPGSASEAAPEVAGVREVVVGAQPSWLAGTQVTKPAIGATQGTASGPVTGPLPDLHSETASTPGAMTLGSELGTSTVCANCGATLPPNARFCTTCGTPVAHT